MRPDHPAAVADPLGDGADGQHRSVGCQHRIGRQCRETLEEFLFDGEVFDNGLDDQAGILHRGRQVGDRGHRAETGTGHLAGLHSCRVQDFGVGVGDDDLEARRRQDAGDPAPHQAGADHGGAGKAVRRQHAVYPPSRYITWPV